MLNQRNIFGCIPLFLFACLFISCSIEKRHYRQGYYLERHEQNTYFVDKAVRDQNCNADQHQVRDNELMEPPFYPQADTCFVSTKGDSILAFESMAPVTSDTMPIKRLPEYPVKDTNSTRSTYEWVWPLVGTICTTSCLIAEIYFGWYVAAILALMLGIYFIVYGFLRISKYFERKKSKQVPDTPKGSLFNVVAFILNVLNSVFALLLSFWLGAMLLF